MIDDDLIRKLLWCGVYVVSVQTGANWMLAQGKADKAIESFDGKFNETKSENPEE